MLFVFLLKGIAVGFVIAVPVGPVGVLCVRRTIFEGRLFGFVSGLGAASADTIFGIIAGFGLTVVSNLLLDYQGWLRSLGGLFLVYIGIRALRQGAVHEAPPEKNAENLFAAYLSTFVLTITNPVTILAFLGIFAAVGFTGSEATVGRAAMLVAGVFLGSLIWWLGLSLGAGLFRQSIGETHLVWLNRASGTILTLSGIALLASLAYDRLA
ncbi:MAG: lysine transporter LysE [Rhodospirillales bacterium]|jgi:threonine/homoserine/homoserine lactone efflux protein|nr:lysine transporter LysE [Rhodospirillales bacterium]